MKPPHPRRHFSDLACGEGRSYHGKVRVIIQQGSNYIDGDGMPISDHERGFIALTPEIKKAHDFKDRKSAEIWMVRKGLTGSILEVEDDDSE